MMLPTTMADYATLLGVAGLTVLLAIFLPTKWGWRAFPLVIVGLVAALLTWVIGVMPIIYEQGGGMVVHMGLLHLALATIVFWLTLALKQRQQHVR